MKPVIWRQNMITNDFYNFNYDLLSKSNLILTTRNAKSEEHFVQDENGGERLHTYMIMSANLGIVISETDILSKPILGIMILFGIFDTYLDTKYPALQGKSFKQKHDHLPVGSNIEIIQKSFFRIYKLIRNAITHSADKVNCSAGTTTISYTFNGSHFQLQINDDNLLKLYTATLLLTDSKIDENRGTSFKEGLLNWYYDDILSALIISDDCSFDALPAIVSLNPMRDIIINSEFSVEEEKIIIKNSKFHIDTIRDFAIEHLGECYVIPQEHLCHHAICTDDLPRWKADSSYLAP